MAATVEMMPALAELPRGEGVAALLGALDGDGEETRLIGGAVRDALMGRPVGDVDLATTALPDEVTRRAEAAGFKAVPTGIAHGTVTVIVAGRPFEVTTLREDIETDGRHAVVRFGRDFAADAARRDFTINALSLDGQGRLHDDIGGLPDIAARRVRFIGDARRRIAEDYLRILRFFRFTAAFGEGPPDAEGFAAAVALRGGLRHLSAERVRSELLKLLAAPGAAAMARVMLGGGFWPLLLDGVPHVGRLAAFVAAPPTDGVAAPLARLAALAVLVQEDAERLRARLRLSSAEARTLAMLAAAFERLHGWRNRQGRPEFDAAFADAALTLGAPIVATAIAIEARPDEGEAASALRRKAFAVPPFPLSGADILARGVAPGPAVGRILVKARASWIAAGCPLDPGAVAAITDAAVGGTPGRPAEP